MDSPKYRNLARCIGAFAVMVSLLWLPLGDAVALFTGTSALWKIPIQLVSASGYGFVMWWFAALAVPIFWPLTSVPTVSAAVLYWLVMRALSRRFPGWDASRRMKRSVSALVAALCLCGLCTAGFLVDQQVVDDTRTDPRVHSLEAILQSMFRHGATVRFAPEELLMGALTGLWLARSRRVEADATP